jgi:Arc/MetJ-type ribon-helix-helix transcriptional regulator
MTTHQTHNARLPVRLPGGLLEEVRALARADGEALAVVVRQALRDLLERRKREAEELRLLREGRAP